MDFTQLAEQRYSVRSFSDKPVEQEKINLILEAGRLSPTACNRQPQRVLVLQSPESLEKLRRCWNGRFHETLAMLVCFDDSECWQRDYDGKKSGDVDASIVAVHLMLKASELGIGSTWVMHFNPEAVKEEFNLPDNIIPVALLPMGYPADNAGPAAFHSSKKPLEQTVFFEKL